MKIGDCQTIYALSSGSPPAAIAVVRISGPEADAALQQLCGFLPPPRLGRLGTIRHPVGGELLDQALLLRFSGPNSATGEDVAELHLHGGRAVVASVLEALTTLPGLRPAQPGEFTRRSFENGRIDLAQAEGLADLLEAETQSQRRAALALAGGSLSRAIEEWQRHILALGAAVEAALDFSDEGEVGGNLPPDWPAALERLKGEIESALARPPVERLRDGVKLVIAGPPNSGKSTLLNVLSGREAAITSAIAGTTRDLVEAPTAIGGTPFLLTDTAGIRDSDDEIENIGVDRARRSVDQADIILWLGKPEECPHPQRAIVVQPKADLGSLVDQAADLLISAKTGQGMDRLVELMVARAAQLLPPEGELATNARHKMALREALDNLEDAAHPDLLIASEGLRRARISLDLVTGRAGVEQMLDALFARFCIGK